MKNHRKIITVLVALTALVSAQKTYGMKRITNFFGGSSKKDDSRPSRDDSRGTSAPIRGEETTRQQIDTEKQRQKAIIRRDNLEHSLYESGLGTKKPAPRDTLISGPIGGRRITLEEQHARAKEEAQKLDAAGKDSGDAWLKATNLLRMKETVKDIQAQQPLETTQPAKPEAGTKKLPPPPTVLPPLPEASKKVVFQEPEKREPTGRSIAELRGSLDTMAQQMAETRKKIRDEEAKSPVDQDQKLLKQLNLEKKKLGDKASSMQQSVKNIENRNQLEALSNNDLTAKVDQLKADRESAQRLLEKAQATKKSLDENLESARAKLSSRNQKKYDDLAEQYTSIRDKLGDKSLKLPQAELDALKAERDGIKSQIGKISKGLSNNHEALANHEATLVTARSEVKRATTEERIAQTVLEARVTSHESEPVKKPSAQKPTESSEVFFAAPIEK